MSKEPQINSIKLKEFMPYLKKIADEHDSREKRKQEIIDRLSFVFHGDEDLAKTVYDYAAKGHLSYCNQLRERFKPCRKKQ